MLKQIHSHAFPYLAKNTSPHAPVAMLAMMAAVRTWLQQQPAQQQDLLQCWGPLLARWRQQQGLPGQPGQSVAGSTSDCCAVLAGDAFCLLLMELLAALASLA